MQITTKQMVTGKFPLELTYEMRIDYMKKCNKSSAHDAVSSRLSIHVVNMLGKVLCSRNI